MLLQKLFLDHGYLDTLERLAIEDGWITHFDGGDDLDEEDIHMAISRESNRDPLRGRVLRLLTLFESVDSSESMYDWSELIEVGVVLDDAKMLAPPSGHLNDYGNYAEQLDYEQERVLRYSKESSRALLKYFKKEIIKQRVRTKPKGFSDFLDSDDLIGEYDWVVEHLGEALPDKKLHLNYFANDMYLIYRSFTDGLYYSCMDGHATFAPSVGNLIGPEPPPVPEIIDDLYYLVRTRLSDEVLVLPQPRSITEAIDMKNTKEMRRFREVLSRWLDALHMGNEVAEMKIRNDIGKANKEIEKLKSIERFKESPINFWFNAIGGHIPIFSDVLNAFNTVTGLYEMWLKNSNSWVLVVQRKH